MNHKLKDDHTDRLFEAILKLETIEECYNFFEDIGTISEIKSFAQRFAVAQMLTEKKTYREIHEKTGASEATISRVNRALNYGADGYRLVLERFNKEGVKVDEHT
ncbi:MAG: YerC/YecD family TrpR-related protein [Clostridia bacterium]|nr:YerC/YecD family TrpR-related protein [Clostridia bacterium]